MHMKTWLLFLTVVLITLWPTLALAQTETASDGPVRVIGYSIVELVAYVLVMVVTGLVSKLILALERRYKVDVPDPWEATLLRWVDMAIDYAEEQGRKAVTKGAGRVESKIPDKLELAVDFVLTALGGDRKLVGLGKEWLKKLIESRLHTNRNDDEIMRGTSGAKLELLPTQMLDSKIVKTVNQVAGADMYIVTFVDGSSTHYTGMQLAAAGIKVP